MRPFPLSGRFIVFGKFGSLNNCITSNCRVNLVSIGGEDTPSAWWAHASEDETGKTEGYCEPKRIANRALFYSDLTCRIPTSGFPDVPTQFLPAAVPGADGNKVKS